MSVNPLPGQRQEDVPPGGSLALRPGKLSIRGAPAMLRSWTSPKTRQHCRRGIIATKPPRHAQHQRKRQRKERLHGSALGFDKLVDAADRAVTNSRPAREDD